MRVTKGAQWLPVLLRVDRSGSRPAIRCGGSEAGGIRPSIASIPLLDLLCAEAGPPVPPANCCWPRCCSVLRDANRSGCFEQLRLQPAISLFRWCCSLSPMIRLGHPTTFTKNAKRRANERRHGALPGELNGRSEVKPLLSDEHFSMDGHLLQACGIHASLERIRPAGGPHRHAIGPARALALPKPAKNRAKGISAAQAQQQDAMLSRRSRRLLARKSTPTPLNASYGARAHGPTAMH